MTPKTTSRPAAAPSRASETAKQSASLARRTSRPRHSSTWRWNGWPISQVELAFLITPVAGEMVPGMPMPTVPVAPVSASISCTMAHTASTVAR